MNYKRFITQFRLLQILCHSIYKYKRINLRIFEDYYFQKYKNEIIVRLYYESSKISLIIRRNPGVQVCVIKFKAEHKELHQYLKLLSI
jgi:hypothetical protein